MPNKNYREGAQFEREIRKYFEAKGFIAARSAGSHGLFDIWATDGSQLWLVQAKKNGNKKYAEKVMASIMETLRSTFPIIGIPIALFVATDLKDGKLLGHAKMLLPTVETLEEILQWRQEKKEEHKESGS